MVKINFNTPLPHSQRDVFIKAFRSIGWGYDRIFQNGDFTLLKFHGKLPSGERSTNIDILVSDDTDIDSFKQLFVGYCEIYFYFERS